MSNILNYFNSYSKKSGNGVSDILILSNYPKNKWVALSMINENNVLYATKNTSSGLVEVDMDNLSVIDKEEILNKLTFKYEI